MSESHELYKQYKRKQFKTEQAKNTKNSNLDKYEKEEEIARSEWLEQKQWEKKSRESEDKLFGNIY